MAYERVASFVMGDIFVSADYYEDKNDAFVTLSLIAGSIIKDKTFSREDLEDIKSFINFLEKVVEKLSEKSF